MISYKSRLERLQDFTLPSRTLPGPELTHQNNEDFLRSSRTLSGPEYTHQKRDEKRAVPTWFLPRVVYCKRFTKLCKNKLLSIELTYSDGKEFVYIYGIGL